MNLPFTRPLQRCGEETSAELPPQSWGFATERCTSGRNHWGYPMTASRFLLVLAVAAIGAVVGVWPGASHAQTSGCYSACPIPATSAPAPRYAVCLGVRSGNTCTVCPGQQTGQSLQLVSNKAVTCLKACAKG